MILKSSITVLLVIVQVKYILNVKEINFIDKFYVYLKNSLTFVVSFKTNWYLSRLKIKTSFLIQMTALQALKSSLKSFKMTKTISHYFATYYRH